VRPQFNPKLKTSGGGISVSGLTGETKADTSGGGLKFTRLHGPLDGATSGGGIRVADCEGTLKVHTSGGGIDVSGGTGRFIGRYLRRLGHCERISRSNQVESSGGGITLENVAGKVEGSTSGGSISAGFQRRCPMK